MRKERSKIVDKAIQTVEGFEKVYKVIHQNTVLRGQSKSTFQNYLRRISLISLHFDRLPENITDEEINEYLTGLALDPKSPSRSSFKHMVYGLRYYFRHIGQNANLSGIFYVNNSEKCFCDDIDFERKSIHIRQSKYKKDRIVPLSNYIAKGLKKYIAVEHPYIWVFNGKEADGRYSPKGLSWVMREALKKTNIQKKVNLHSLRHSYATHLLEDGVNIVTIKELLGHATIQTTMIYLHVAQLPHTPPHSPLDTLYPDQI